MKKIFLLIIAFLLSCSLYSQIKVACVGNSITYGAGITDREHNSYPAQLQNMLGKDYVVKNFGNSGTTLLKKGDFPYWKVKEYKEALAFNPDIVFIKLGTNDSKPQNRIYLDEFINDYTELINSFQNLKSKPKVILLLPVPVFSKSDVWGITDSIIVDSIIPKIREVAYQKNIEVINLYNMFVESPELFPDKVHPNKDGAAGIAKRCREVLEIEKDTDFDIIKKLAVKGTKSNFFGYDCYDFMYENNPCKIVIPKFTAKGKPWLWKARFWDHVPQTQIALLERGFHIVYCDVNELFGNHTGVERWNKYYDFLRKGGLAQKTVLMGLSRGGLYVYSWALENAEKVACIYADAPVLDIKSWPGRFYPYGGSGPDTWEACKKAFSFKSDEEAKAAKVSPVDKVEQIAKLNIPLLHICGLADKTVPYEYNTKPFAEKIREFGGSIKVIEKPGIGHHPHSLLNPAPIIDFILEAVNKK